MRTLGWRVFLPERSQGERGARGRERGAARALIRVALVCAVPAVAACASAGRSAAWERSKEGAGSADTGEPAERAAREGPRDDARALQELLERAEARWAARDDRAAALEAVHLWAQVVERDPHHWRALTRLSRAYHFVADAHFGGEAPAAGEQERLRGEYYQKGADAGELALMELEPQFARTMREGGDFVEAMSAIRPDAVEAAYWYCSNLSRFSQSKGFRTKLFYKDRVAGAMHRIRELDAPFQQGGADRVLGAIYATLPRMAGKDLERSEQHFRAAQALGPTYLGNYLLEAELLAVQRGERQRYIELLQAVLAAPPGDDPDTAPENRAAKRAAQRLLAPREIDARF